jgi:two-component system cell cycle response regulator
MPKLPGTEVCRRIKSNPETLLVPVVLISALTATQDRVDGIDAGADDFLTNWKEPKPCSSLWRVASKGRTHTLRDIAKG